MYLIWSLGCGGAEKMVCSLAADHGPDVKPLVCCLDDEGYLAGHLREKGIEVLALNKKRGFDLSVLFKLRKIVREHGVQLINSHLWSANLYVRLLRFFVTIPVVTVEHNVDVWKKSYHFLIDRVLAGKSNCYIFVSKAVRDYYQKNVPETQRNCRVIYNGVDLAPFRSLDSIRKNLLASLSAADDAFLLVNVGRLVPAKNQAELIRVTEALVQRGHNVYTLIVGDGPLRAELEKQVADTGLHHRIWLTGTRDDVALILKGCDLFVMTSSWEGLPLVILETLIAGTPPVFYDVGGTAEIVQDGIEGIKVASGDFESMVSALDRLLGAPENIERLRENMRVRGIENFDTRKMVEEYESLFRNIVSAKGVL
ncbi:MAG: glycosyltransferase [Geobacteraceae bacterium]|nr:glycosyltransferase [Geobacteraceae bacterium]